jgi:hypothetical protein
MDRAQWSSSISLSTSTVRNTNCERSIDARRGSGGDVFTPAVYSQSRRRNSSSVDAKADFFTGSRPVISSVGPVISQGTPSGDPWSEILVIYNSGANFDFPWPAGNWTVVMERSLPVPPARVATGSITAEGTAVTVLHR